MDSATFILKACMANNESYSPSGDAVAATVGGVGVVLLCAGRLSDGPQKKGRVGCLA